MHTLRLLIVSLAAVGLLVGPGGAAGQEAIRAVRLDADVDFVPDRLGDTVLVVGTVTAPPYAIPIPEPHLRAYIQDATGGLRVQFPPDIDRSGLDTGASVRILGVLEQQQGNTTLVAVETTRTGPGQPVEPVSVEVRDLLGEAYEGQLIRTRGTLVPAQNTEITDGDSQIRVRARSLLLEDPAFAERYNLATGPAEVVGIAEQYDPIAPHDDGYRVDLIDTDGLVLLPDRRPLWIAILAVVIFFGLFWSAVASTRRARRIGQFLERFQETQAELREREALLQIVTEATSDVIWDHDVRAGTLRWGGGFDELYGTARESAPTTPDARARMIHPDHVDRVVAGIDEALRSGAAEWSDRYRIQRSDGTVRDVQDRARILRDEDGAPLRMVGAVLDTTTQAAADRRRRHLEESLRQAQRLESVGVLAGGVAHDFNNLLLTILGNVELLQMQVDDGSEHARLLDEVRTAADRASGLTLQLLTYAGRAPSRKTPVDLAGLIRGTAGSFERGRSPDVDLDLALARDLPTVHGDVNQLQQVVWNLVANAFEALEPTGGSVTLRAAVRQASAEEIAGALGDPPDPEETWVVFSVTDTGRGIDPDVENRILEPFFTTKPEGRGLGLSAVAGIVKGHGGHLALLSEPGKGSTFSVLLRPDAPEEPSGAAEDGEARVRTGVALVADDEDAVRSLVTRFVGMVGLEVVEARDGLEAIELFDAEPDRYDVALLDLAMPGASGDEVFEHIRTLRPSLPVVMLSGHAAASIAERVEGAQGVEVLAKPFTLAAFEDVVSRLLGTNEH